MKCSAYLNCSPCLKARLMVCACAGRIPRCEQSSDGDKASHLNPLTTALRSPAVLPARARVVGQSRPARPAELRDAVGPIRSSAAALRSSAPVVLFDERARSGSSSVRTSRATTLSGFSGASRSGTRYRRSCRGVQPTDRGHRRRPSCTREMVACSLTTTVAPELRTQRRSPTRPAMNRRPAVAYAMVLPRARIGRAVTVRRPDDDHHRPCPCPRSPAPRRRGTARRPRR